MARWRGNQPTLKLLLFVRSGALTPLVFISFYFFSSSYAIVYLWKTLYIAVTLKSFQLIAISQRESLPLFGHLGCYPDDVKNTFNINFFFTIERFRIVWNWIPLEIPIFIYFLPDFDSRIGCGTFDEPNLRNMFHVWIRLFATNFEIKTQPKKKKNASRIFSIKIWNVKNKFLLNVIKGVHFSGISLSVKTVLVSKGLG